MLILSTYKESCINIFIEMYRKKKTKIRLIDTVYL